MSRYIDADAVKVRYRGGFHDDYVVDYDSFMKAPSIEIPTWIPCSERLPEAGVSVIVTSKGGYVYTSNIAHGEWEYGGDVIAWMPLPEPWKGADDEC